MKTNAATTISMVELRAVGPIDETKKVVLTVQGERRQIKEISKPNAKGLVNVICLDERRFKMRQSARVVVHTTKPEVPEAVEMPEVIEAAPAGL